MVKQRAVALVVLGEAVDGMLLIERRQRITLFEIKDPRIGVEIGRIVGVLLDNLQRHILGLVEILFLLAQIIGIIVERIVVRRIVLDSLVVAFEGLVHTVILIIDVAS